MTSAGHRGGGAGAQTKLNPPSAATIVSATAGWDSGRPHTAPGAICAASALARVSAARAGIELSSSGGDGTSGTGGGSRIAGALGNAGLSAACAGTTCSVDALAGGVGAATAASALSVRTIVGAAATAALSPTSAVAVGSATAEGCGSATAEEAEPGTRPCIGTGKSPYFDGYL